MKTSRISKIALCVACPLWFAACGSGDDEAAGGGASGTSVIAGSAGSTSGSSGTTSTGGSAGSTTGASGVSGDAGTGGGGATAGVSGAAGTSGSAGANGSAGASGTAGASGASGTSGASGVAGTSGASGAAGNGNFGGANSFGGASGAGGAGGGTGGTGGVVVPSVCGDGVTTGAETCDDGNLNSGDGCSPECAFETGYVCSGTPSVCVLAICVLDCGPDELCTPEHLGFDDNCNGQVDEGCGCKEGDTHSCFKGNPSDLNVPGCFAGTMTCQANGTWGTCVGGFHSLPPDSCAGSGATGCHPITSPPFATTNLKDGTGTFSANAVPGSESWTVACPPGVSPCPAVTGSNPSDDYQALQSGEYTVTYTKSVSGQPNPVSCTYPLFIGSRGMRVELTWEHTNADSGVDLDLHVHQPSNTQPWGISPGVAQDCTWSNCVYYDIVPGSANTPHWFPDTNTIPDPVNWYLDPVLANNTCYSSPRGVGAQWSAHGQGCHNPRLDLDNITCTFSTTDPNSSAFCAPENVNIDFPPQNEWVRIGVHYYSSHGVNYNVHPDIKVYCDGELAGNLGPNSFYSPTAPVTFAPGDSSTRFWLAADVAKVTDQCGRTTCQVVPIYADANAKTPYFVTSTAATSSFGPAYPALP